VEQATFAPHAGVMRAPPIGQPWDVAERGCEVVRCTLNRRSNPGAGTTNFDTFPWAVLNVYVVTTLANWSEIMGVRVTCAGTVDARW